MKRVNNLVLFVACALAALLSLTASPAADAPPIVVHGVAARPGGAFLAESDRPPGALRGDRGPSHAIFPAQRLTIRFNHETHATRSKLSCTACHERALSSRSSADRLLPPATRCDGCHGSDHRELSLVRAREGELLAECGFCHLGYRPEHGNRVERMMLPAPRIKFSHAEHVGRKMDCAKCHGRVERVELATRDQLPRMRACISCHKLSNDVGKRPSGACSVCHLAEGSRIQTRFGAESLLPPSWLRNAQHGPDWVIRHRSVAGDDSRFCGNCHTEKDCADCHDGRVRPRRSHPNDFLSLHAVAARNNSPRCTSCHQEQNFCLPCHQRTGVAESGPFANFAERGRFHPPPALWTDPPRSAQHHAWEAQRNLNACISCHVERDCVGCHATRQVGGAGGGLPAGVAAGFDPHPAGFRARCAQALRQNARPCLVCHDPADPSFAECR